MKLIFPKENTKVNLIKSKHGFTFIELSIVMAILSVLSAIALTYFNDVFSRGRDAAAISDAVSLITVVNNHFLDKKSVNYEAISPDGRGLGVEDEDGNPIPAAFTLSPGIRLQFEGTDNISPSDAGTKGKFHAYIYHYQGTTDPDDISLTGIGRRCVLIAIDETTGTHDHVLF
ncbi:MAG: prepilin-type N-terminal cleavage/methylation domain-containing protein [Desulfobacteraceae bacterium]|nr:MAG: prepilin-type N-terminal cleavage/methylation domain-containing protein [Desulfobacteraceae bacterium]